MKPYSKLTKEELKKLKGQLEKQFEEVKAKGIHLDMSRGKPSKAQLDLSNGLMDVLNGDSDLVSSDGVDCRNYGVLVELQRQENYWQICQKYQREIF